MDRLLFHICCAPCFIAPYQHLKDTFDITALWYNHNIHPVTEYRSRRDCLREFVQRENIQYIENDYYGLVKFLKQCRNGDEDIAATCGDEDIAATCGDEDIAATRCYQCYNERLSYTAQFAKENGFDYFSTTLLYSKYQKHELIKTIGAELSLQYDIPFYYADLREYWKEGIILSKDAGMYRQKYCGCIFSEMERYIG